MALATGSHAPAPRQHETPNVVQQGAMPTPPAARAVDPALAEGIDPVLLHRLYPEADSIEDAASQALAQGHATKEAGEKLVASQQEPATRS